ncbi:MAG: GatB/YqeY domain-containing protein [Acidobacteria bacterium]|nr:GatB/YqeY domain-containing protein [Acidobacteriota bacterium]
MKLRDKINSDLTAAMKAKEADRLSVLRMMKSAVKNKEIEKIGELEDAEVMQTLVSLIKQRRDSIEQFTRGGRPELAAKEAAEIKIIEEYLPAAVSDDEIAEAVAAAISELGAVSIKDMGKVMKACMAKFAGRPLDGAGLSELVKAKLG